MTREEVCRKIRDIGILPAIRVASADDAFFAAETVISGGIPIVEITMTVPGALEIVAGLRAATSGRGGRSRYCAGGVGGASVPGSGRDVHHQSRSSIAASWKRAKEARVAAIPGALTPWK